MSAVAASSASCVSGATPSRALRDTRHHTRAEGGQPPLDARTDRAVADQEDTLAFDAVRADVPPAGLGLLPDEQRQLAQARQHERDREFRGAFLVVQPAPVAQDHPGRYRAEHVIDAAAQALQHAQPRQPGDERGARRVTHVGQAVEGDVGEAAAGTARRASRRT